MEKELESEVGKDTKWQTQNCQKEMSQTLTFGQGNSYFSLILMGPQGWCTIIWSSTHATFAALLNTPFGSQNAHQHSDHTRSVTKALCSQSIQLLQYCSMNTTLQSLFVWQKEKGDAPQPHVGLTLRIRLKSSLSTLKKWQLSSLRTIEAALGASFTSANLPKSSPSCRVQTTPWREQNILMKRVPESEQHPFTSHHKIPLPPHTVCINGLHPGTPRRII